MSFLKKKNRSLIWIFASLLLISNWSILLAQTQASTDSVLIAVLDVEHGNSDLSDVDSEILADLFINQLDQFISPVISFKDHSRRIDLILNQQFRRGQQINKPQQSTAPKPDYWCKLRIGNQSALAQILDINVDTITIAEANIPLNHRNPRKSMIQLADDIADHFIRRQYPHQNDAFSLAIILNPKKREVNIDNKKKIRVPYDNKARSFSLIGIAKGEQAIIGSQRRLSANSFQYWKVAIRNSHLVLVPKRHHLSIAAAGLFNENRVGFVRSAHYAYEWNAKWAAGLQLSVYDLPVSTNVTLPNGSAATPFRSYESITIPFFHLQYRHYFSQPTLILGGEAGIGISETAYYAGISISTSKLPWLALTGSYQQIQVALPDKTFNEFGQNAFTQDLEQELRFPTFGIRLQTTL